jgi:hypothetical protein
MLFLDFYGAEHAESEVSGVFQVAGSAGPADAEYDAMIIGGREYRVNLTTVVLGPDGDLVAWPGVQVAHANPAIATGERARDFGSGKAEHFTTTESGTNGAQLGGGSKILGGGPVDEVWVHGKMPDGGRIRSQRVRVGLYSSDIVMSPIFQITRRGGLPNVPGPIQPPPATGTDGHALIQAGLAEISSGLLKVREGEFKLP